MRPGCGGREVVTIEAAQPDDAERLTEIAFAAKRHWGYPEAWIEAWRDVLTITPDYVATNAVWVARREGAIVGWTAVHVRDDGPWLDHLWVLPAAMGGGIGRRLFEVAEAASRRTGAAWLAIESDPHAEKFYQRMGAETVGRTPAFRDGRERYLPILRKTLG